VRLFPDCKIFLSYFARGLKRQKASLVWGLGNFGGEIDASGTCPQIKITRQVQGLLPLSYVSNSGVENERGTNLHAQYSTARNASFGLQHNLVHFRALPNRSKPSGFRSPFRDKLDLTTAIANHLASFRDPAFLERVPSGSFEDFPFHPKQRNWKLAPWLLKRLFHVIASLHSPAALHSELCLYYRFLCLVYHYIHRHRDEFTYHGTQRILNLNETGGRQSLTPNP
jgi:hypothetical protein